MCSRFWVKFNNGGQPVPRYDRDKVHLMLKRAASDPVNIQQMRSALEKSSRVNVQTFRLDDRQVVNRVADLVFFGEVILAPAASPGTPKKKEFKKYEGDKFSDPVKKKGEKWVAVWPVINSDDKGELGEVKSGLESNVEYTTVEAVFEGPFVDQQMLEKMNGLEKEKVETKEAKEKREKELKEAEKEKAAAQKKIESATTPQEKNDAEADLEMADGKVQMAEHLIETHTKHLAKLELMGPRAVKTLRIHEQTHVDVAAEIVEHLRPRLETEHDPGTREKLFKGSEKILRDVTEEMDRFLNPGKFGSEEDVKALETWISTSESPNYHDSVATRFANLEAEVQASKSLEN